MEISFLIPNSTLVDASPFSLSHVVQGLEVNLKGGELTIVQNY